MKVLVTGAAGNLGSETVSQLLAAGNEVVATDVKARRELSVPLQELDLLDATAVVGVMGGVDAVVHLGNLTGVGRAGRGSAQTFNENVAMNMNVFQAALEAHVRKIVFASSVQVIASESFENPYPPHARKVAYLPLDTHSPPNPANGYALSKCVGETMLQQYIAPHGVTCVSLRYPWICPTENFSRHREFDLDHQPRPSRIAQGFSLLSTFDAAGAILACLRAQLSGYHVFFPAVSPVKGEQLRAVIQRHYADVPLRRPIEEMESLVDYSEITRSTGWAPRDRF